MISKILDWVAFVTVTCFAVSVTLVLITALLQEPGVAFIVISVMIIFVSGCRLIDRGLPWRKTFDPFAKCKHGSYKYGQCLDCEAEDH